MLINLLQMKHEQNHKTTTVVTEYLVMTQKQWPGVSCTITEVKDGTCNTTKGKILKDATNILTARP